MKENKKHKHQDIQHISDIFMIPRTLYKYARRESLVVALLLISLCMGNPWLII